MNNLNKALQELIEVNKQFPSNSLDDTVGRNQVMCDALNKLILEFTGDCEKLISESDNPEHKRIAYNNKGKIKASVFVEDYDEAIKCFNSAIEHCKDDKVLGSILLNKERVQKLKRL